MFKKFFPFFIFLFISIFSFYLTSEAIEYLKDLDPIMNTIKDNKNIYEIEPVNAIIDDIYITPGIKGLEINIDSSYKFMKKYGQFNDNLLVYEEVVPKQSITKIYDKYITRGNSKKNNISLVFKINDNNYLQEIVKILKEKEVQATFFIDQELLLNDKNIIKLLYNYNQKIENLGLNNNYTITGIDNINHLLNSYMNTKMSFCYSDNINNDILKICSSKKLHTIIPTIITDKSPYSEIKNKLNNGIIIRFNNNLKTIKELKYIINYIRQSNYKIVSLEKLLEE